MVTFCSKCGTSLPYADIIIRDGSESIANYYKCPECNQLANPPAEDAAENQEFELDEQFELVIKRGECATRAIGAEETAEPPAETGTRPQDEKASQEPQ